MRKTRGFLGMCALFAIGQSCTNDFDKFDVTGDGAPNSGGTSSGGKTPLAGTSSFAGLTSLGGRLSGTGGKSGGGGAGTNMAGAIGEDAGGAGGAGAAGGAGGAGEVVMPCGGPCTLEHATAECVEDACAVTQCDATWGDCNVQAGDGCEHALTTDTANCGACNRACSMANIASIECGSGACSSSCAPGFANCTQAEMPDDGCETPVTSDAANCGGCANKCPAGFVCSDGRCGCDFKNDCGNGNGVECVNELCQCGLTECRPGERCRDAQGSKVCSCNGGSGAGCSATEFCCEDTGCTDVQANAANCGACGRACSAGFACAGGACQCDSVEDCGGGPPIVVGAGGATGDGGTSAGGDSSAPADVACVTGLCICKGSTCAAGQRCLANGACG